MTEFNFNTLQNLPVPDGWVDKALAIPEQEQKAAVVPFWRRRGLVALAASLVLVSAVSVALFLNIGSSPPVAVKSSPTTAYETTATGEIAPTDDPTSDGTQPTEPKAVIDRLIERIFGAPDPTAPQNPTEQPTTSSQAHPTQIPTEAAQLPTEAPHDATTVLPTELDWEEPTELPTEAAWQPPTQTPWINPTAPTEKPWVPPTTAPTEDPEAKYYQDSLSCLIPTKNIPEGSTLYIKLIDGHGNLLGDPDLYSDQHLVTVVERGTSFTHITYTPKAYGIIPERGYYRYTIYNQDGVTVQGYYRVGLNP